jgi:hypothetical protein
MARANGEILTVIIQHGAVKHGMLGTRTAGPTWAWHALPVIKV